MGGFSGLRNPFFTTRPQDAFFNPANFNAPDPTAVPASPNSTASANAAPAATASAAEQPKVQPAAATPEAGAPVAPVAPMAPTAPAGPLSRDAFFQQNPDATKAFIPP